MKSFITMIITVTLVSFVTPAIGFTAQDIIYISEPAKLAAEEISMTQITFFKSNGKLLRTVFIDGMMAKVSPDGKYIAYIKRSNKDRHLIIADSDGNTINKIFSVAWVPIINLEWSPTSEKIAALVGGGSTTSLIIIPVAADGKKRLVHSVKNGSSEEAYFYTLRWLPDGKSVLLAASDGARIIDTESANSKEIFKEPGTAKITADGKRIIYISKPDISQLQTPLSKSSPTDIWRYDVETQQKEKLLSIDALPAMAALSGDGKYLLFHVMPSAPLKEPEIFLANLAEKKLSKLSTKGMALLPKAPSSQSNKQFLCFGGKENDKPYYGIFNIEDRSFLQLKKFDESDLLGGEWGGLLLFMGFDWVDWR